MSDSELNEADEASLQKLWSLYKDRDDDQHPDVLAMLKTVSTAVRDRFISDVSVRKLYAPIASRNFERLAPGDTIGSVEVLRKLRRGGTATIYQGIQSFKTGGTPATRDVVIKVMSPLNTTKNQVEREANVLMRLNADPHIVNLYSVEPLADGTYAIVLELVQSGNGLVCSLQELLEFRRGELQETDEAAVAASLVSGSLPNPLTPEFVVEWLRPVANALAFAHGQGALHRDLKPGNILIRKSKDGLQLLLADWGFGKLGEGGVFADMTAMVGTLRYMAPEVLSKRVKSRLAHRTDIYSFGLTFQEMLTLKKPKLQSAVESEVTCAAATPAAVKLPQDITTIIDRCVEPVPECRVKSFDEIVRSFDLYLAGQPISIRCLTPLESLWFRIVASPVLAVGLLGTLIAALSVTVILISWNSWKHRVQEAAIVSRDSMNGEDAVYAAEAAAKLYDLVGDADESQSALALERFNWSRRRAPLTTSQFSWPDENVQTIRFDPTGKLLIAESKSGQKRVWNASTGDDAQPESSSLLTAVAFAADGRKAFAFQDGTVMVWPEPGNSERVERINLATQIDVIAFHPAQQRMAISHEGLLEWDLSNNNTSQITTSGRATHLEYSDENNRLLSLDKTGLLQVLDLGSTPAVQLLSVKHRPDILLSSYFCYSGSQVVVLSGDSEAEYVEVGSGRILKRIVTSKKITSAAILRTGITRLALGGEKWMSHYSSPYFTEELTYTEHDNEITSLRWSEDAELILSASQEGSVRGWYPNNRYPAEWVIHLKQLTDATCDPAGRRVATLQAGGIIRVWELPRPWRSPVSDGFQTLVSVSPDGQYFVPSGSSAGKQKMSYTRVRAVGTTVQEMSPLPLAGAICGAIFRPGNETRQQALFLMLSPNRLEFCEFNGEGQISECTLPFAPLGAAFSPSGDEAVVCLEDGSILVVDPDTGQADALVRRQNLTTQWTGHKPREWIAFAPDGQHFATWGLNDNVTVWNLADSKVVLTLKHQHPCFHATFSKDGQYLAVASTGGSDGASGVATLWNTKTGDQLQTLDHRDAVVSVEFSPDSKTLLTASRDRSARLWTVETGELKNELVHRDEIYDAALLSRNVNPNQESRSLSLLVATVTAGWTLDLWDALSGERIAPPLLLRAKPLDIDFSFSHDMLFVGGDGTGIECIRLSSPDDLRFSDYAAFGLRPFAVAMTDYSLDMAHGTLSSGNGKKVWDHLKEVTQQYATRLNEPLYLKEVHEEIAANARKNNHILTAKYHDLLVNPRREAPSEPLPELPTPELPIVSVEEWRKQVVDPVVKGDWAKALEIYENIFRLSEPTEADYTIRSMLLFDAQRYEAALSDCEKLIELGTTNWTVRLRRARCRTYLGQWEKAVEELDGLVQVVPDERDILMERAEVNGYLKRWSSCRTDYRSLILRFNDQQYARYSYAIACGSEGLTDAFEEACREYNIANQLNATPLQLLNTAILYAVCGDLETHEHAELLKVFIDNWKQADYYESFVKGALHYRLGNFDTATSELTAAVEKTGELGTPLDLSFLAMCQIEAGELRIARKTLDDAHKSFARLQQGFPRGVVREKPPKSRPIGDISTWPNYAQSLLVLAEAEKLLVSKESEKPDVR